MQLMPLLAEGVKSKNSRQKAETLEQMGVLIEHHALTVCQPIAVR